MHPRGCETGIDRVERGDREIGLSLRRALADLDAVPAADEVGQDSGGAGLHAARLPGRLRLQVAIGCAAQAVTRPPDALVEADHQLRIGAVAKLGDRTTLR